MAATSGSGIGERPAETGRSWRPLRSGRIYYARPPFAAGQPTPQISLSFRFEASYVADANGTSNVLAGKRFGIPIFGTMAHRYVQAHDDELTGFQRFSVIYPETMLLADTYDTLQEVWYVIALSKGLGENLKVTAMRLDSGDLASLSLAAPRLT